MQLADEASVGYLVAQLSDDEPRAFGIPSHSSDLAGWGLLRIKNKIDSYKNPPKFTYMDTPLARLVRNARPSSSSNAGKNSDVKSDDNKRKSDDSQRQQKNGDTEKRNQDDNKKKSTYQKPKQDVRPA